MAMVDRPGYLRAVGGLGAACIRSVSIRPTPLSFFTFKLIIPISIIIIIIFNTDFNFLKISLYPGHLSAEWAIVYRNWNL